MEEREGEREKNAFRCKSKRQALMSGGGNSYDRMCALLFRDSLNPLTLVTSSQEP